MLDRTLAMIKRNLDEALTGSRPNFPGEDFLCDLNGNGQRPAILEQAITALVDSQRSLDQTGLIFQQPSYAVAAATLLI